MSKQALSGRDISWRKRQGPFLGEGFYQWRRKAVSEKGTIQAVAFVIKSKIEKKHSISESPRDQESTAIQTTQEIKRAEPHKKNKNQDAQKKDVEINVFRHLCLELLLN